MVSVATSPQLAALLELKDPVRFVLPSRDGFSGAGWLRMRTVSHRSPGWSNPPQWLALKPGELLTDQARFAATNQPGRSALSERWSRPEDVRVALSPDRIPPAGTRMVITGDLSGQDLLNHPELPAIESAELLSPTTLDVLVDQRGRVFKAALAPGGASDSPAADVLGRELARSLQFVVDPRIDPSRNARDFDMLREARITFHWWIRPPTPPTNSPAADNAPATEPPPVNVLRQ
jgi:hypothetical protein